MSNFRPSDLRVVSERDPKLEGAYHPSSFLRLNTDGKLEQMWWSNAGEAVWEVVPQGEFSLKDLALGNCSR